MAKIVFTCGDINGIGPEICIRTFNALHKSEHSSIIFTCPSVVFEKATELIQPNFRYQFVESIDKINSSDKALIVLDIGKAKINPGIPTKDSGDIAKLSLQTSIDLLKQKIVEGVVTAPISKEAMLVTNFGYPGHTEFFASSFGVCDYVMMFVSDEMKCSIATIHEPLKNVPSLLDELRLQKHFQVIHSSLINDFKIDKPRIAVLGLNPHAGESGAIGTEELDVIKPAIEKYTTIKIHGPFVPDAFFGNKKYLDYDLTVGMYHDQVLIPFKLLNFNSGVNYTAGLPIVRTSPDHGTAFDIAWKGKADHSSMLHAYRLAQKILENRNAG